MAAPSWKDDAEVVFTKHIALRSGSDYTVLDKILTQRADDDATAPNGILSPSAGTFTLTDTRQGAAQISPSDAEWPDHNENSIHGDSWTFHDGSAKGATRTDGRDEATRIADANNVAENTGPESETFDPGHMSAANWSSRTGVTNPSWKEFEKQGDGSTKGTIYWRYADDYLREYQAGRLTQMQSCADGFLISSMNMKIQYEMVTGGSLEQVTKLEDWWNRNGYAHLSRNGVWNEDKYSTNKDGTIPNSTVYPSGHPLAS